MTVRHGRVTGVILERDEVACSTVVLALGPWSAETSAWLDVPIEVRPLKGQILRLQAPGPPVACSVGWGHNYATTKSDGPLWAGATEEESGFDRGLCPRALRGGQVLNYDIQTRRPAPGRASAPCRNA